MKLNDFYELKKEEFKKTGRKEKPDKLLALLLLQDIDSYEADDYTLEEFYERNKVIINLLITKVIKDFEYSKGELISIIEESVLCQNYEEDLIWHVFSKGISSLNWALRYGENYSPEQIYSIYFHDYSIYNTNGKHVVMVGYGKQDKTALLRRLIENPEELYNFVFESMSGEEKRLILFSLKNKSCETCTNGSCSVETYEKDGLDEFGKPQGHECLGWYNDSLIAQSKIYNERDILKLKYRK